MGAASPSKSMIVATVAPRSTCNVSIPRPGLERAALLAKLDVVTAVFWCTVFGMVMVTGMTPQFSVVL